MNPDEFWAQVVELARTLDGYTYYELLAIPSHATPDDIRAAYARRTAKFHPDRHGAQADPERTRALVSLQARFNEAYRLLSNPVKRADYDAAVAHGLKRQTGRQAPVKTEEPTTPQAKRYFEMARQAERASKRADAVQYFKFALQLEPESTAVQAALARLGAGPPPPEPVPPRPAFAPTGARLATIELALPTSPAALDAGARATPVPMPPPVRLHCKTWPEFLNLHARGLARGDLFVRAKSPLAVGTVVRITVEVPNGDILEITAAVAHVIPPDDTRPNTLPGLGLHFDATDELRRHIEALAAIASG